CSFLREYTAHTTSLHTLFHYGAAAHADLHSFPTRRSSDLASPPGRPRRASACRRSTRSPTNLTETTGASNARCPFTRPRRGGPGRGRRLPRWREWTQGHVALPPAGGGGLPLRPRSAECDADRRRTDERHARA